MKKGMLVLAMTVLVAGASLAYAEHEPGDDHGMMGKGCPMMGGMMQQSMVATSDGGVVIRSGDKLVKYDKNLNVVKEAEVKMDKKGCAMKDCPMMKGKKEADHAPVAENPPAGKEVDHSKHH